MSLKSRLAALLLPLLASTAQAGDIDQAAALTQLAKPGTLLIDVRSAGEFASGACPAPTTSATSRSPNRSAAWRRTVRAHRPVLPQRPAGLAQDALQALGYQQVINAGGIDSLKAAQQAKSPEAARKTAEQPVTAHCPAPAGCRTAAGDQWPARPATAPSNC